MNSGIIWVTILKLELDEREMVIELEASDSARIEIPFVDSTGDSDIVDVSTGSAVEDDEVYFTREDSGIT